MHVEIFHNREFWDKTVSKVGQMIHEYSVSE